MEDKPIQELVSKYLTGECTDEEREKVEEWYASFEEHPDPLSEFSEEERRFLRQTILLKINRNTNRSPVRIGLSYRWFRYFGAVAAVVLVALGLSWSRLFSGAESKINTDQAKQNISFVNNGSSVVVKTLPDGSSISLYPGSSISYLENRSATTREVTLNGEAFFDVYRDAARPFIVYSKKLRTKVLGTSFRICAWDGDVESVVAVRSGKVSVRRMSKSLATDGKGISIETGKELFLTEDQSAVVTEGTMHEIVEVDKNGPALGVWKTSNLVFDNVPVKEVVGQLNEIYDVHIEVESSQVDQYILKADLTGMNLTDILEILENSLGLTYRMDKDHILLNTK